MRLFTTLALALTAAAALPASAAEVPASLRGSPASMVRQNQVAKESDYSFLRDGAEVQRFVAKGLLVPVDGDDNYRTSRVSFPYARPEVATFIERLGAQYRDRCDERMVVTSLTRPKVSQPGNAHELSVHPAGMAVDLRISRSAACRAWLEATLLSLERKGLLDVTRERNPPHYHVAVFPEAYGAHLRRLRADSLARAGTAVASKSDDETSSVDEAAEPRPIDLAAAHLSPDPMAGDDDDTAAWAVLAALLLIGGGTLAAKLRGGEEA
jgi:Family of unknown function (DUF5715)